MGSGKKGLVQRGRSSVTGPLGNGQQYYINRSVDVVDRAGERSSQVTWTGLETRRKDGGRV
jgi:hypothetical protein